MCISQVLRGCHILLTCNDRWRFDLPFFPAVNFLMVGMSAWQGHTHKIHMYISSLILNRWFHASLVTEYWFYFPEDCVSLISCFFSKLFYFFLASCKPQHRSAHIAMERWKRFAWTISHARSRMNWMPQDTFFSSTSQGVSSLHHKSTELNNSLEKSFYLFPIQSSAQVWICC